jgi:arsenate reductase
MAAAAWRVLSEGQENAMTDAVTIYHNPACSTSRQVVEMVRDAGATPVIVEYLKTGWTEPLLRQLMAESGLTARELMRTRGDLPGELGLLEAGVSEDAILAAMVAHPVLVERPIVQGPRATVLARPKETALNAL